MEQNSFWQANFWGILGSITGAIALTISYLSHRYNTPDIKIEHLVLLTAPPLWIKSEYGGKNIEELRNRYLDYTLKIKVRNSRGGAGSIDKPTLLIKIPLNKNSSEEIRIFPRTEVDNESFNITGGQSIDDVLEYDLYDENLHKVANNFEKLKYFIEYKDNRGKRYIKEITEITVDKKY